MLNLTEIKKNIRELETSLSSSNHRRNEDTFRLFSLMGLYTSMGGKEDLVNELKLSVILSSLPTEKAKMNYVMNAINYSTASEIYLTLMRCTKSIEKRKYSCLLLPDLIVYVNKHAKAMLDKYDIRLGVDSLNKLGLSINNVHISNYEIHSVEELEKLYLNIIYAITKVKLDDYMINMLKSYLN